MIFEGEPTDVLFQVFECPVLSYAPSNPTGWKLESSTIGRDD